MIRRFYLAVLLLLPVLVSCAAPEGRLKPLRPADEGEFLLVAQPQLVTFSQLQEDPVAYRDRLIRVSGSLLKLPPPKCVPYTGPITEWALIAEGLRLDATGLEAAISLLRDGTPLTVDGFFRLYEGPLGCGKAAADGSAWFLEVLKIVQPNPLIASGPQPGEILPGTATIAPPVLPPGSTATSTAQATAPGTGTPGIVPTTTPTGSVSPAPATPTVGPGTITATAIPTASPTASATSRFTPTPTLLPGTLTVTPIPTPTSPGSLLTPTPTPTVDTYPGPGTPTPTATVDGYPPSPPITMTPGYP